MSGTLGDAFTAEGVTTLRRELHLSAAEAATLIGMTPSARHVAPEALPTTPSTVTAAVDLTRYRARG